ncbi:MAG: uL15m family ribosomal protein [Candidatus Aenigmatarchaeota archaeon]
MVVRREKKRRRGERTYHGRHAKRRGAGSRGGRGNVSYHKHLMKFREREKGFKYPLRREINAINLDELNELIKKMIEEKKVDENNLKIDLSSLGYQKLLGRGNISFKALIEVEKASKKAIEKVKSLGGEVIVKSPQ